jgi:hypothetical protein
MLAVICGSEPKVMLKSLAYLAGEVTFYETVSLAFASGV